jgi:hypothetical protein
MVTRTARETMQAERGEQMADDPGRLPSWVTWQQRPFPDANPLSVRLM